MVVLKKKSGKWIRKCVSVLFTYLQTSLKEINKKNEKRKKRKALEGDDLGYKKN